VWGSPISVVVVDRRDLIPRALLLLCSSFAALPDIFPTYVRHGLSHLCRLQTMQNKQNTATLIIDYSSSNIAILAL
jgi:hypothetical protein